MWACALSRSESCKLHRALGDTYRWLRNGLSGLLSWDGILEGREHAEGWEVNMLWPLYAPVPGSVSPPEPVSLQQRLTSAVCRRQAAQACQHLTMA